MRHLSGCAPCSALASELAHFIQASVRLAPSTADRISQRLHAALAEEASASQRATRAGWVVALAGAGTAGALALMLLPALFSPSAGPSIASLSLPQGPAQKLTDPLQPIAQLPGALALTKSPEELAPKDPVLPAKEQALATEAPAPLSAPKVLTAPGLAALHPIAAPVALAITPTAAAAMAKPTPTSSPTPPRAAASRSLTRSAGARLTPGLGALNPLGALPGMPAATPIAALPQPGSLTTSLPEAPLTAPSSATGTASR
jgi:hypothetical protein